MKKLLLAVMLCLLIQPVSASIYSFNVPRDNGVYDIIGNFTNVPFLDVGVNFLALSFDIPPHGGITAGAQINDLSLDASFSLDGGNCHYAFGCGSGIAHIMDRSISIFGDAAVFDLTGYRRDLPVRALVTIDLPDGYSIAGVPEPSTWALMLLGFAGLASTALRRRKKVLV